MNRFQIMPCMPQSEISGSEYKGMVLPLGSETSDNCVLFFPVSEEAAEIINLILEVDEDDEEDGQQPSKGIASMLEVYKTMIRSWKSGDRFLTGIFVDMVYDQATQEEIVSVFVMLGSMHDGYTEAILKTTFVQSMVIAAIENIDVMISDELLYKLIPRPSFPFDQEEREADVKSYPVDENIINIAKKIMNGKIK